MPELLRDLLFGLLCWSLGSLGAGLLGLHRATQERWRGFWLMTGLWGWVDGAIVCYGLLSEPLPTDQLARILLINVGLDIVYILIGVWLALCQRPLLRGFGLAIVIQGVFLLGFDLGFHLRCRFAGADASFGFVYF